MLPTVGNISGMTLKTYLKESGLSLTEFGDLLGVSEHAVRKWVYGQRTPDLKMAVEIERITGGKVTVAVLAERAA